jgi:hypothetical protein
LLRSPTVVRGAERIESELCVERKNAVRAVERHNPCAAGQRPRIDLEHRRIDSVSPSQRTCAEERARLKRNPHVLGVLCLTNEPRGSPRSK